MDPENPGASAPDVRTLLEAARTIAVVGASANPAKAANRIPASLIEAGYRVIPVNPTADAILGEQAYPTLADVPVPIDIVDVFRPTDEAPDIARQAAAVGAKALWLQLGVASDEARAVATEAGLDYVEDRCIGAGVHQLGISVAAS